MPCDITKTSSDIENVDWSTGTGSGPHYTNVVRFGSSSSQASQSSGDICRICHCESDPQNPLLTPCYCSGSLKYVHQACLQQWLTASETNSCELCKFPFIMHTKIKPFNEWRSLDISGVERRRLCCSVLFHCAAALCVIWSLCVLIERAAYDVQRGLIDWPFWTKLAVVTVGLTGGVVFMYIQCRAYLHLCHRWKARNRILLIQNAPEKVHPISPPSPVNNRNRNILHSKSNAVTSDTVANVANTTNNYNYNAYNSAAAATGTDTAELESGVAGVINNQRASPSSHLINSQVSFLNASEAHHPHAAQHGQIVANIESNSQNYDRDWTLDDVSQISSFRPCPQGSGSMTPFHDSIHNVLNQSNGSGSNSVNTSQQDLSLNPLQTATNVCSVSETGRTNDDSSSFVFEPTTIVTTITNTTMTTPPLTSQFGGRVAFKAGAKRYSNSSVFPEHSAILNDSGYPRVNYRHSSVLTSPDISDNLDKFLGKDLRRYSDTKLLASDTNILNPMIFNVALQTPASTSGIAITHDNESRHKHKLYQKVLKANRNSFAGESVAQSILDIASGEAAKIPDVIFESATLQQVDSHELNSPNFTLDMDQQHNRRYYKTMRRSLNTVETGVDCGKINSDNETQIDKGRLFFKSLPNLSSSCESLIKK